MISTPGLSAAPRFDDLIKRFSQCRRETPAIYRAAAQGMPAFMKICLELMLDDTVGKGEVFDWMAREVRKQLDPDPGQAPVTPIERKWAEVTMMSAFELFGQLVSTFERTQAEHEKLASIKALLHGEKAGSATGS